MKAAQLKNSILQMAVQGRLVSQDPKEEPASALLERIREEKKRLIKEGKIKKADNESIIYRALNPSPPFPALAGNMGERGRGEGAKEGAYTTGDRAAGTPLTRHLADARCRPLPRKKRGGEVPSEATDNLPYNFYERTAEGTERCIDDDLPFDIPDSWEWVRLGEICEYIQRGKSPKYSLVKKYPVIAQKCNQWSGFSIEKAKFIEPDSLSNYTKEKFLQNEDLLWNSTGLGTLGRMVIYKTALNPYELAVADSHVTVIRPFKNHIIPNYLFVYFVNPSVQSVIEAQADGTTKQKELATSTIQAYYVPLPPLAEQKRIVARIEELLPLVEEYDRVERELTALDLAFPARLKKSILQEAVRGKLVPQDPTEEPAAALLERIRKERAEAFKAGKIKGDKGGQYDP